MDGVNIDKGQTMSDNKQDKKPDGQHELEIALSHFIGPIGETLDELLINEFGQKVGFMFFTFALGIKGHREFNYFSNCDREEMIKVLEGLIKQLKRPKYKIQPYHNKVKIN